MRRRTKTCYHNIVWSKKGAMLCLSCVSCGTIFETVKRFEERDQETVDISIRNYHYIRRKYGNIAIPSVNERMVEKSRTKLWERVKIWESLGRLSRQETETIAERMESLGKRIQENHVRQVEL